MNTLLNSSLSWKASVPVSSSQPYSLTSHGSAVAKLIGIQAGLPLHTSSSNTSIKWSENEREAFINILNNKRSAFQSEDHSLLLRRVGWRMRVNSIYNFDAYKELLAKNPAEMPALRKSISMRITDFFKDPNFFVALERTVFPQLMKDVDPSGIQTLITDCGTGELAYSIAMLFAFLQKEHRITSPMRFIACDQDEQALQTANKGYYPHLITADLSPLCLNMFFNATAEGYQIGPELQQLVHFEPEHTEKPSINAQLDVLVSPEPLIFQRDDVRIKLIETFHKKIRPGGFLILNPLSHSDHVLTLFEEVDLKLGIYQRKATIAKSVAQAAPLEPELEPDAEPEKLNTAIEHLENELIAAKERLSSTIHDYENSHDELVDINHELRSSVDKLILERDQIEAEKNSLQAMVRTIMQANKDLKHQNKQLHDTNHQWEEVISLCGLGILLVDPQLCINMFTPEAATLFGLKKPDVGRPLSHLNCPFKWNIAEAAATVQRTRMFIEKELASNNNEWYHIKVSPLIKQDEVTGVVFSFINTTEHKREHEWDRFRASILNQFEDAVLVTNKVGKVTYVNQAAVDHFGLYHKKKTGYSIEDLYQSISHIQEDTDIILERLSVMGRWSGELYYQSTDGKSKRALTTIIELKDDTGEQIGHLNIIRDSFRIQMQDNSSLQRIIEDLTEKNEALSKD